MRFISGFKEIKKINDPVVAMGVFDGVHRGHRKILGAAVIMAERIKGTSVVLTFWPHPQKEESLCSLEHRLRLFSQLGVDVCVIINFNKRFAGMSAGSFIKNILCRKLGARYVYVGKNFRFGRGAQGDLKTLEKLSGECGYKVKSFEAVKAGSLPISSTLIRRLIKKGELSDAARLLGRPASILGTVIRGSSLAGKWGIPTANLNPHHEVVPPAGIYAVKVIYDNREFKGVCYIGARPTMARKKINTGKPLPKHVEVFIFDFNKDIYGQYLEVQFVKKIRKEQKFATQALLVRQIKKDIFHAKKLFPLHQ